MTPKSKTIRSNEILKETTKNSYFSKYLEENRTRIKQKNNSLKQSKPKTEQKEICLNNQLSLYSYKKSKNNSMDKNHYYKINNINQKKSVRNLNNAFNDDKNIEIIQKKSNNLISINQRYLCPSNNSLLKDKNKSKNLSEKEFAQKNNKINENKNIIPQIKNLSKREKSYLILSYSKCLRLCERLIFSRSTKNLRDSISVKDILDINKIYLKEKLKEIEKKIENCEDKLKSKFEASKTAEMTLNFITSNIENEFKLDMFQNLYEENERKYYFSYIKLIYLLLDENYEKIENEKLIKQLYQKIGNKGYRNIKDYLYFIYIKNLKENKSIENIDKINEIINSAPNLLNFKNIIRYDKFISYTFILVKEIINYANEKLDTFKLKKDCINFIEIINSKLNLYKEKME
jgi:hypothetical protein